MSTYRLDHLFLPKSIALFGASPREKSLGRTVLANLRSGGFAGPIHLINPNHPEIDGVTTIASVNALAEPPDLAVVTAPPAAVPEIIAQAGEKGCAATIVLSSGLGHGPGSYYEATAKAARRYGIRLVGPNCLGVLVPPANINASFAVRLPRAGDLALISQSGAIAAGLVEWAAQEGLAFPAWCRLATRSTSILATSSTISRSTAKPARS